MLFMILCLHSLLPSAMPVIISVLPEYGLHPFPHLVQRKAKPASTPAAPEVSVRVSLSRVTIQTGKLLQWKVQIEANLQGDAD